MLAAQALGVAASLVGRLNQGPQAHPHAFDVSASRRAHQVARGLIENKVDFQRKWKRLARQIRARRVGRAQNDPAQPGYSEQHPAIGGLGNHQRHVRVKKLTPHHQVHALARCH